MQNAPRNLTEVLSPFDEGTFLESILGKQFSYAKGWPGKFGELLPWSDLNQVLRHHDLDTPRLRVVKEGRAIQADSYTTYRGIRAGARRPRLRPAELSEHLRQGATLILDSIDEIQEPITKLAAKLEEQLRARVQVNMYAGWRTSRGFDLHWDGHDVLVLQVSGRKKWGIYGFTREHPLPGEARCEPPSDPIWEGFMEDGDLLYIPRGCWHVALPLDEPTLHLTFGLHRANGVGFMEWFASRLRTSPDVRQDLPRLAPVEVKREHLERLRAAWAAAWNQNLLDEYFAHLDERAVPRPEFNLPWSAAVATLSEQDRGWSVKWIAPSTPIIEESNDTIYIACNGKRWKFAAAAGPILRALQEKGLCVIDDLYPASGGLNPAIVRAFVSELSHAGLVALARETDSDGE